MAEAMKLLPCPMCGGEAALLDYEARYGGLHYASRCPQCASCGCSMGYLPTAKKAVEAWNCRASMPAPEKAPSFDDARRKLIHCIEQWDGETEYDAEDIAALADDILDVFASPPAREEAPAEGAGERDEDTAAAIERLSAMAEQPDVPGFPYSMARFTGLRLVLAALRNRTSEPEAGEAIPTNVYWSAEGQNFYRMDTRAGCGLKFYAKWRDRISEFPTEPHPAPATADKLRVAVDLLNDCIWLDTDTGDYRVEHDGSVEKARAILAALNEQPQ